MTPAEPQEGHAPKEQANRRGGFVNLSGTKDRGSGRPVKRVQASMPV